MRYLNFISTKKCKQRGEILHVNIPTSKNKWAFFFSLCLGRFEPNHLWRNPLFRIKFFFRTILLSPMTIQWLGKLSQLDYVSLYLSCQTNLINKGQRPYLSSIMTQKMRFAALDFHYRIISAQPKSLIKSIYNSKAPMILCTLTGKTGSKIKIAMQSNDKYSREGEISLYISDVENNLLSVLTFSFIEYHKKLTLFIGGLQGSNSENIREKIQKTTKECYGLFPKRLLAECIAILAQHFKINQIVAVSNATHIYNNWRYKKRFAKMHADYDDFWMTLNAEKNDEELFLLSNTIPRKAIENIASKKRSEYRNRYALLDQLSVEITKNLFNFNKLP